MAEVHPIPTHPSFQNLIGKPPFGDLTVIAYVGCNHGSQWLCRCPHGHEQIAAGCGLTRGRINHCKVCKFPSVKPDTKACRTCKRILPFTAEHFPENCQHPFGLRAICRACRNVVARVEVKDYNRALRMEVLTHYSGGPPKCACCGIDVFEFLALDHLEGSSRKDYAKWKTGASFFAWIRREGFPATFRVLCHNCNECKAHYGYCVHRPEDAVFGHRCQNPNTLAPLKTDSSLFSKQCRGCNRSFPADAEHFPKHAWMTSGLLNYCKECDRDNHLAQGRARKKRQKEQVFSHYCQGEPHCLCCGEAAFEFLTIDHIEGGGSKHRKAEKIGSIHSWLIKHGMPSGYAPLCFNCNMAKGFYNMCPHNKNT